jgi:DNA-binding MarR family transcriptional regulator
MIKQRRKLDDDSKAEILEMATIKKGGEAPGGSPVPDGPPALDLESNLAYRISMLNFLLGKATARVYGEEGLSSHQWKVLSVLNAYAPMPARAIEKWVTLDKAAISRTVRELLNRGLVERKLNSVDARTIEISLSQPGQALYSRVATQLAALQSHLFENVTKTEQRSIFSALDKVETKLRS